MKLVADVPFRQAMEHFSEVVKSAPHEPISECIEEQMACLKKSSIFFSSRSRSTVGEWNALVGTFLAWTRRSGKANHTIFTDSSDCGSLEVPVVNPIERIPSKRRPFS